jgi:hypothetical protein
MAIFRSIGKRISGFLFITLGIMWLSGAITPCVLAASLNKSQHDCCPAFKGNTGHSQHMHEQGKCGSCELVQPVLQSADNYLLSSATSSPDFQPVIIEWNYNQTRQPVTNTYKLLPTVDQTLPPPLRFRVLLI